MKLRRLVLRSTIAEGREEALQRAVRFLALRSRSEAEVTNYLARRGYSTAVVQATLEKLRSLNYLNDESFARDWARSRYEGQGYGPRKIAQELEARGIAETLISIVVGEIFGPGREAERARFLLEKNFKQKTLDDPKILHRAAAFLQRHGYSDSVIVDLLKLPVEGD